MGGGGGGIKGCHGNGMGKKGAVAAASTASGKATLVKEESAIVQESSGKDNVICAIKTH